MPAYRILHYCTEDGTNVFGAWLDSIADPRTKARIAVRIDRLAVGLFGDVKALREGVWEVRIDCGPGYRLYYAIAGRAVLLLLCGGVKGTQARDIARAVDYWKDWQERQR